MKKFSGLKAVLFAMAVLLLAGIAFGHTKANAADDFTWAYDAAADKVTITPTGDATAFKFVSLGKKTSGKFKADKFVTYDANTGIVPTSYKVKTGNKANFYVTSLVSGSSIEASANVVLDAVTDSIKTVNIAYYAATPTDASVDVTVDLFTVTAKTAGAVSAGAVEVKLSESGEYMSAADLTTGNLYELINGTKPKIWVRIAGTSGSTGVAKRPSKEKKVSVKTAKDLKSVKVDYVKGTIKIGNGYDYFVSAAEVQEPEVGAFGNEVTLKTILPFNKQGTVSPTAITTDKYFDGTYKVVAKPSGEELGYYTSTKVKALGIDEYGYWYVRKSATGKAPASKFVKVGPIAAPVSAPAISGEISIASKGAITIANFSDGPEFAILTATEVDEATATIKVDLGTIKWAKFKNGKTKNNVGTKINKTKEKYDVNKYIAFRTPGVKGSTLPSDYVIFKIGADSWTKVEVAAADDAE
jgi:hypothetical protein